MHYVDTHCHINMMIKKAFDVQLTQDEIDAAKTIIDQAANVGVDTILNVGTSLPESMNCVELARTYASCYAAVGIHPNDCTSTWRDDLLQMQKLWFQHDGHRSFFKIVAIGEIGLDKHYPGYDLDRQIDAFKAQVEWALKYNLPVIIHTRDAQDQTLKILQTYQSDNLRGVIHCFSEDQAFADDAIKLGFHIGIGGTLSYPKNSTLRAVMHDMPLQRIVLETDAPFLPPQSMRGKQNSPIYIPMIAQHLAEVRGVSLEEVANVTTANARTLFAF